MSMATRYGWRHALAGIAGVQLAHFAFRGHTHATEAAPLPARRNLFLQGLAIQITNPKALLFVSALLPQFIRPERPLGVQIAVLLTTTVVVDVIVLSTYAWFAQRGARLLQGSGLTAWLERVFGAALIAFGLRLLASREMR
jgi:homoserine/homoserine lactone efflux protein